MICSRYYHKEVCCSVYLLEIFELSIRDGVKVFHVFPFASITELHKWSFLYCVLFDPVMEKVWEWSAPLWAPCCSWPIKWPKNTIISGLPCVGCHRFSPSFNPIPLIFLSPFLPPAFSFSHPCLTASLIPLFLPPSTKYVTLSLTSTRIEPPSPSLGTLHPFLPQRPLRPTRHNEISASLIVLIKAVRKELRKEKCSWQQGKTRAQWCFTNALISTTLCFFFPPLLPLTTHPTAAMVSLSVQLTSLHSFQ